MQIRTSLRRLTAVLIEHLGRALIGGNAPLMPRASPVNSDAILVVPDQSDRAEPWIETPSAQIAPAQERRWTALAGGILELSKTGFTVRLCTDPTQPPYMLRDPDGRWIAASVDLQSIKALGERCARDRDEFSCLDRDATDVIERLRRNGR